MSQRRNAEDQIRFVAVSATIPNSQDIAEWFPNKIVVVDSVFYSRLNAQHFSFGPEFRPVPLELRVVGLRLEFSLL
jgi:superfamily II RNA helicase